MEGLFFWVEEGGRQLKMVFMFCSVYSCDPKQRENKFLERESSIDRSEIAERAVVQFCGEGMLRFDLLFFDYFSERFVAVLAFV